VARDHARRSITSDEFSLFCAAFPRWYEDGT
jgi:hypothetical protein